MWLILGSLGWSDVAKVSCILRHRGVQLIVAYSWARLAFLVGGKGRGGMFLFLLCLYFYYCSSLSFISSTISSISFLPFSGRRHEMTHKGWLVVTPQQNQSNLYQFSMFIHMRLDALDYFIYNILSGCFRISCFQFIESLYSLSPKEFFYST